MTAAKDRWTAGHEDEDDDPWSALSTDWAALWGPFADPARRALVAATGVGPGTRVLDVGCGSGELLAMLTEAGAEVAGADVAAGMVALAARAAPGRTSASRRPRRCRGRTGRSTSSRR